MISFYFSSFSDPLSKWSSQAWPNAGDRMQWRVLIKVFCPVGYEEEWWWWWWQAWPRHGLEGPRAEGRGFTQAWVCGIRTVNEWACHIMVCLFQCIIMCRGHFYNSTTEITLEILPYRYCILCIGVMDYHGECWPWITIEMYVCLSKWWTGVIPQYNSPVSSKTHLFFVYILIHRMMSYLRPLYIIHRFSRRLPRGLRQNERKRVLISNVHIYKSPNAATGLEWIWQLVSNATLEGGWAEDTLAEMGGRGAMKGRLPIMGGGQVRYRGFTSN